MRLHYGSKPNIAILISGRGSNMGAIIENKAGFKANIVGVISSKETAPGRFIAEKANIPSIVIASKEYKKRRKDYDQALATQLRKWKVDLVVLAGFMRILSDEFVAQFPWQIINIHPSLLPAFPGLHPHKQVIKAGVKVSGCTVHFVAPGDVDAGPIIAQVAVSVRPNDSPESLAKRILGEEHRLFSAVIAGLVAGKYAIKENIVFRT